MKVQQGLAQIDQRTKCGFLHSAAQVFKECIPLEYTRINRRQRLPASAGSPLAANAQRTATVNHDKE
jgi:hypothetical protein